MKSMFQVKELVKCSLENEVLFEAPRVKIVFASGITKSLHRKISKVLKKHMNSCRISTKSLKVGAEVGGDIINMSDDSDDDLEDEDSEEEDSDEESLVSEDEAEDLYDEDDHGVDDTKVNLDITAMIAYVSAMTNGRYQIKQ